MTPLSVLYLVVVCACIVADVASGLLAAWITGTFRSEKMREGAQHKVGELLAISLCYGVQYALPLIGVMTTINFVRGFSIYIVIMEVSSVVENIIKLDPELSGPLGKLIDNIKGVFGQDE